MSDYYRWVIQGIFIDVYPPIKFPDDEKTLSSDTLVRYLLLNSDLESGRRHAGDLNWSSQIYHICESLVQKNQPVLYWLVDDDDNSPKRSFVREELIVIPDTELPFQWVLSN